MRANIVRLLIYMATKNKIDELDAESKKYRVLALRSLMKIKWIMRKRLLLSRKRRRNWSLVKPTDYWESSRLNFSEQKFKNSFRVNRSTFHKIVSKMQNLRKDNTTMRDAIPLEKRIAIALYALGSSSKYRAIADLFGVGRSTVGEIVLQFCKEILTKFSDYFEEFYPCSENKIKENVEGFMKLGFPQCYGVIDCCHIKLKPPKNEAADYYNFKGTHSTILFAAVDYRYRFMYLNIGSPGGTNNSTIWENSFLKRQHAENTVFKRFAKNLAGVTVPVLLIGDSAFELSEIVMKPFPFTVNQSDDQKKFNYRLSKCRRVVENAFGHLKARFRRIDKGLEVKVENALTIIKACCILHNLCNNNNDKIKEKWLSDLPLCEISQNNLQHERELCIRNETGVKIRDAIKNYLATLLDDDDVRSTVSGNVGFVVGDGDDGSGEHIDEENGDSIDSGPSIEAAPFDRSMDLFS